MSCAIMNLVDKETARQKIISQKSDKDIHDNIVHAVKQLLDLYPKISTAVPAEKRRLEDKIAHIEKGINELVYQLYA